MIPTLSRKTLPYFTLIISICLILSLGWRDPWISASYDMAIFLGLIIFLIFLHIILLFERPAQKGQRAMTFFSLLTLSLSFSATLVWVSLDETKGDFLQKLPLAKTSLTIGLILYLLIRMARLVRVLYTRIDNPAFIFAASFILLTLGGTGLLMLPEATVNGISFIDAVFTSTSAVCVTGLTVLDTAKEFTFFGKTIIMILIELGGLGILTITSFFGYFFRGGASFREGLYISNFLNADSLNNVTNLAVKVVSVTLAIECVGAIMIYSTIEDIDIGPEGPLFFAAFHAISAFCNAGFSTLSEGLYALPVRYNYALQLIIIGLLVLGGHWVQHPVQLLHLR